MISTDFRHTHALPKHVRPAPACCSASSAAAWRRRRGGGVDATGGGIGGTSDAARRRSCSAKARSRAPRPAAKVSQRPRSVRRRSTSEAKASASTSINKAPLIATCVEINQCVGCSDSGANAHFHTDRNTARRPCKDDGKVSSTRTRRASTGAARRRTAARGRS